MADVQGLFPIKIGDGANSGDYAGVTSRLGVTIEGVQADGAVVAANPILIGGQDGTNVQSLNLDSTGRTIIVGAAADGAAVDGNPVLIAGHDGTNVQTLLTDSTGALAVSGVSDISNTDTITALNDSADLDVGGRQGAAALVTGTWTATLEFQVSTDDGTTWTSIPVLDVANDIYVASTAANGLFVFPTLAGMTNIRVTATAFTSGTATVRLTANNSAELLQDGTERVNGGTVPYRGVQMAISDGTNLRFAAGDSSGRQIIIGAAADGAAVTGNPVLIAGQDGTNVQSIFTDTTGRQVIVGAAADGGAVAGNPVLIAGSDGTNAETLLTDSSGRLNIVGAAADGAAVAGNPVLVAGSDGTNTQTISTDTNGYVNVNATVAETSTGTVAYYATVTSVANNTTGTITYTTSGGVTFFLKTIIASASAGPCKIEVDYGAGPTTVAVGFITDAVPVLQLQFAQPIVIPASTAVNVKITNRAGRAQDVYATIIGLEV